MTPLLTYFEQNVFKQVREFFSNVPPNLSEPGRVHFTAHATPTIKHIREELGKSNSILTTKEQEAIFQSLWQSLHDFKKKVEYVDGSIQYRVEVAKKEYAKIVGTMVGDPLFKEVADTDFANLVAEYWNKNEFIKEENYEAVLYRSGEKRFISYYAILDYTRHGLHVSLNRLTENLVAIGYGATQEAKKREQEQLLAEKNRALVPENQPNSTLPLAPPNTSFSTEDLEEIEALRRKRDELYQFLKK